MSLRRAEERVDGCVVGDVVAHVEERGGVDGRKPDAVDAETGEVGECAGYGGDGSEALGWGWGDEGFGGVGYGGS